MTDGCEHPDFEATVDVHRLKESDAAPVDGFMADVRVRCAACKQPFKFLGLELGLNLQGAACSYDREEARLTISPDGLPSTSPVVGFKITERSGRG